jgi:hypothetical protein
VIPVASTQSAHHHTGAVPLARRPSAGAVGGPVPVPYGTDSACFTPSPFRGDIPAGALLPEVDG